MKRNLFLGAALALVLSAGLTACKEDPHTLSTDELSRANIGGEKWAIRSGETFLSCNGTDSPPKDDHTSCTIKPKQGVPYIIQCSYKSEGCKPGK